MPRDTASPPPQDSLELIATLREAAEKFVPQSRAEDLIRKFLSKRYTDGMDEAQQLAAMADAYMLSTDLLLSQPSVTGATAFDRLAKSRGRPARAEAEALAALCKARFRLLQIDGPADPHGVMVRDVITGASLRIVAPELPTEGIARHIFSRAVEAGGGLFCLAGAITPLDPAALEVARNHPAAGGKGVAAAARWAEALYTHIMKHGTYEVPGLNRPMGDVQDLFEMPDGPLGDLAAAWAELAGGAPDEDLLAATRQSADMETILDALGYAVEARHEGLAPFAEAFEQVLAVQLETVRRREASGAQNLRLDDIARTIDHSIRHHGWPEEVRGLFQTLRSRLRGGKVADDPAMERLMQRIAALRAKTVAQGCTEQEALAAAEKVAELLDRHGLSMNELEFKAQPCEGAGIQTNRRRTAPIDNCIPVIAAFFDCRVWFERSGDAPLRYIFFGLRGDVAAAQYLYELVERAFDTETDKFRAGAIYRAMAGERRTATTSFQAGLAHGISEKLRGIRAARDSMLRSASGRDLVPVKAAMVDDEMDKLGLKLTRRTLSRGRHVFSGAFAAGKEAGDRFEYAAAVTHAA